MWIFSHSLYISKRSDLNKSLLISKVAKKEADLNSRQKKSKLEHMFVKNKKKVCHLLSSVSKFSINKLERHPIKTQFLSQAYTGVPSMT